MTCCFEDFKTLISTTGGQNRIKAEYTATFNRPPVGHCESSLRDMYEFLRSKNQKPKKIMAKLKVKEGFETQQIAGSVYHLDSWSQAEIQDYLKKFPRAISLFEPIENVDDIREKVKKSKK